jgi:hypothetical protein
MSGTLNSSTATTTTSPDGSLFQNNATSSQVAAKADVNAGTFFASLSFSIVIFGVQVLFFLILKEILPRI